MDAKRASPFPHLPTHRPASPGPSRFECVLEIILIHHHLLSFLPSPSSRYRSAHRNCSTEPIRFALGLQDVQSHEPFPSPETPITAF